MTIYQVLENDQKAMNLLMNRLLLLSNYQFELHKGLNTCFMFFHTDLLQLD